MRFQPRMPSLILQLRRQPLMLSLIEKSLVGSCLPSFPYEVSKRHVLSLRKRGRFDLDAASFNLERACGQFGASFFILQSFEFARFVKYVPSSFMIQDIFALHVVWGSQYVTRCLLLNAPTFSFLFTLSLVVFREYSWMFVYRGEKRLLISLGSARFASFLHFFGWYTSGTLPFCFLVVAYLFIVKWWWLWAHCLLPFLSIACFRWRDFPVREPPFSFYCCFLFGFPNFHVWCFALIFRDGFLM